MKPKLTEEERAFRKQYDGAAIDEDELAAAATTAGGRLGYMAARLLEAKKDFEAELERIEYENG